MLRRIAPVAGITSIAALSLALAGAPADAAPALLVDASNGQVLFEEQAADPWYPASLTKLMTTYVVLKEIQAGRLSLDTPLKVSANAAKAQPSKMGFKPGTVVTVDNALKMMLVRSANDIAVVLAEGVGGSIEGFAAGMNAEARRLGMNDSYFVNPNGLMDPRQRSTARDLAILARALLDDFPQFQSYFGIGGVQLGKNIHRNTNGLIGRYPGAEGMKTGFICASGFNVVATARDGNRRLIAVLLGEPSAARRTIHAAELFDSGFSGQFSASRRLADIPTGKPSAPPNLREVICNPKRANAALVDDDNRVAGGAADSADGSGVHAFFTGEAVQRRRVTVVEGEKPGTLIRRAEMAPIPVFVGPAQGAVPEIAKQVPVAKKAATVPPAAAQAFAPPQPAVTALEGAAPVALQGAIAAGPSRGKGASLPLPPPRP